MLEADKSNFFERIFSIYNRNLLNRRFHSVQISGAHFLLNETDRLPLIIYCNHSSWWDGLVAFQVSSKLGLNSFVMMEEKHLRRLFLFRKLGAFSVVRENPRAALKSIKYAAELLKENSNSVLWIFPQGEILPNDRRPLKFYIGLAKIIEIVGKCRVASLSMRYEFLGEYKPQIFIKAGEPEIISVGEDFNSKRLTENLSINLTENLNRLKNDVISGDLSEYRSIL